MEQLDQEITLQLQRIDSNLSWCFGKITREIIPCVEEYGVTCDDLADSVSYLGGLFQGTGFVNLPEKGEQRAKTQDVPELQHRQQQQQQQLSPALPLPPPPPPIESSSPPTGLSDETNESTRQRRKRKVSLLLQQEYGSSSPRDETLEQTGTIAGTVIHFSTGRGDQAEPSAASPPSLPSDESSSA